MAEFSSDIQTRRVDGLLDELFEHVLYDEEPLFVSDEAKLWDISMSDVDEVLERLRKYYGVPVSVEDTRSPLWMLLRELDQRRKAVARKGY